MLQLWPVHCLGLRSPFLSFGQNAVGEFTAHEQGSDSAGTALRVQVAI